MSNPLTEAVKAELAGKARVPRGPRTDGYLAALSQEIAANLSQIKTPATAPLKTSQPSGADATAVAGLSAATKRELSRQGVRRTPA